MRGLAVRRYMSRGDVLHSHSENKFIRHRLRFFWNTLYICLFVVVVWLGDLSLGGCRKTVVCRPNGVKTDVGV